jgi:hypothetical protein
VPNVQWKTPDDGQRNRPKHVESLTKEIWEINASVDFIIKKCVTMHGHMNGKFVKSYLPWVIICNTEQKFGKTPYQKRN